MTVQLPSSAVQGDGSVSVQEAAAILGCSEKTVRRKIKAQQLLAHRLPTSQGYEWRVHLDSDDQVATSDGRVPASPAVQVNGRADHLLPQRGQLPGATNGAHPHGDPPDTPSPEVAAGDRPAARVADPVGHLPGQNRHVPPHPAGQVDGTRSRDSEAALLKALELTDRLQRENMELAGRVGFLQAKLQTAEEQLLALTAGPTQEEAVLPPAPPSRSWWKFWEWAGPTP